eukprot:8596571-Karenia_brevis.AAC.1
MYLEAETRNGKLTYQGTGFVQYRGPRSLQQAWNYPHCVQEWSTDPAPYGSPKDQIGFAMYEEISRGKRRMCCLETTFKEFAIRENMGKQYGQFGQRGHLDPTSSQEEGHMHNSMGVWDIGPYEGLGWGTPTSAQEGSSMECNSQMKQEGGRRAREPAPSRNPRSRKDPRKESRPEEGKEEVQVEMELETEEAARERKEADEEVMLNV